MYIIHVVSVKDIKNFNDPKIKNKPLAKHFIWLSRFFGGRNWGQEFSKCNLSTNIKSKEVKDRAILIVGRIGGGGNIPVSPLTPNNPPIGGPPLEQPLEQSETSKFNACFQTEEAKNYLLTVMGMKNWTLPLKISFLRVVCDF